MDTETRRLLERQAEPGWATLFWDVFERSLSPIVLVDESRRVLATNSAAADLLGYRARDLVGRPIDELITKPTRAQREKEWRRLLKTGEQSGAYTYVRRDGSQLEVDFAVRLVRVGEQELGVAVAFPLGRVTFARQAGDQAAPLTDVSVRSSL
jgi:PAS domain S-box-containing protein